MKVLALTAMPASPTLNAMNTISTTLTIRNLDEPVKQKLRMQAASHGRSMEAEARAILTLAVQDKKPELPAPLAAALAADDTPAPSPFAHLRGIWKGRMSTDEIMQITRGE